MPLAGCRQPLSPALQGCCFARIPELQSCRFCAVSILIQPIVGISTEWEFNQQVALTEQCDTVAE